MEQRVAELVAFAAALRPLGPANFLYTDGDAVFAHGHRRKHNGEIRPPGLHLLCRSCSPSSDGVPLDGVSIAREESQEIALVASVPLSAEHWEPLVEGEVVVLREGRVVLREPPPTRGLRIAMHAP